MQNLLQIRVRSSRKTRDSERLRPVQLESLGGLEREEILEIGVGLGARVLEIGEAKGKLWWGLGSRRAQLDCWSREKERDFSDKLWAAVYLVCGSLVLWAHNVGEWFGLEWGR
jgi:hypothetical protein